MTGQTDVRPQSSAILGCYVYGIVETRAELAPGLEGIDGVREVFLVHGGSVAAVTSLVCLEEFGREALQEHLEDLSWLERRARSHEQILERVREQTTLVPMRLCTIYRDERSVGEMLAREQAFLANALSRLHGRTEWGVKMYAVPDLTATLATGSAAEDSSNQSSGPGASYLMQKRLQADQREQAQALTEQSCERAYFKLAQAAVEAKLNPIQPRELTGRDEPMVFNGVYLVDDSAFARFASIVGALHSELAPAGVQLELTGPWTPYNFVGSPPEAGG